MQARHSGWRHFPTHPVLVASILLFYLLSSFFVAPEKLGGFLMVMLGYFSLLLICLTLVIGPIALLRRPRNPVHMAVRRDLGIWAGATGVLHVWFTMREALADNHFLLFFLRPACCGGYALQLQPFGIANDLGLIATILLILLTVISNTFSLRLLKGKWWKRLQRLTYPMAVLALLHTFIFQYINIREPLLVALVLVMLLLVLICQSIGIALTLSRRRQAQKEAPANATDSSPSSHSSLPLPRADALKTH